MKNLKKNLRLRLTFRQPKLPFINNKGGLPAHTPARELAYRPVRALAHTLVDGKRSPMQTKPKAAITLGVGDRVSGDFL